MTRAQRQAAAAYYLFILTGKIAWLRIHDIFTQLAQQGEWE